MTSLYLFDHNQKLIKIIPEKELLRATQLEELQDDDLPIDRFTAEYKLDAFKKVDDVHYMAVKDLDNPNQFHMYYVTQPITNEHTVVLEGKQLGHKELKHTVIQEIHPQDRQANFMLNQVLTNTDWRVGYVDSTPDLTQHFYYLPALECLKVIASIFSLELVFKVEINGQKITDKWIEAYHRRGARTMKRFTHGSNVLTVKGVIERSDIYTALIGRGRGEETEDGGFGRRINFSDIEWSVANGDPVDKPLGQNYVEIQSATAEHGINRLDGSKMPALGVFEDDQIEDPAELLRAAYDELVNRIRPLVLYQTTVADIGKADLGEVVGMHRYDLGLHYETRIKKLERNYLDPKRTPVELGDQVYEGRRDRENRINRTINRINQEQQQIREEISYVVRTADGMNTITYGNTEPEQKRVGDSWVRDHPTQPGYTQWLMWNGNDWEITSDSYEREANKRAIEEAQEGIQDAKDSADAANQQINDAINAAGFSTLADLTADIQSISTRADANALAAIDNALSASTAAESAMTLATDLSGQVSDFELTVNGFNQTVNNYTDQVAQFTSDVNGLNSTVASYETQVDDFGNTVSTYATQVSQFENTVNGLNSTVSSYQSDVQGYQAQVSTLTNTVDGFNATVQRVEADYGELEGTVQSLGASIGVVEGQITNKVWQTDIQSAVDGLGLGNRNYLKHSRTLEGSHWAVSGSAQILTSPDPGTRRARITGTGYVGQRTDLIGFDFSDTTQSFAVSVWVYSSAPGQTIGLTLSGSNINFQSQQLSSRVWQRYTWVFKGVGGTLGTFRFNVQGATETNAVLWELPQIEKATKVSDWTPAPEDAMELISHVETEWRQTAEGFEQSITRVESGLDGKASLTAFNTLQSTVNGTVQRIGDAEGNITQIESTVSGLQTTIANKASQTEVTQLADGYRILSEQSVQSLVRRNNDGLIDWDNVTLGSAVGNMTTTEGGTRATFRVDENSNAGSGQLNRIWGLVNNQWEHPGRYAVRIKIRGSHTNQRIAVGQSGAITEWVTITQEDRWYQFVFDTGNSNVFSIYFHNNSSSQRWYSISDLEVVPTAGVTNAQLSVLNDNINMRVKEGDVMSQINIEAGRTLIDTDRLYLSANTTVFGGSAFIPNAAIESLSADKLTAGTIDASEVNVINLNASDIATGTISGANMFLNLNEGIFTTTSQISNQLAGIMTITHGRLESVSNIESGRFVTLSGDQLHFGDDDGYIELTPRYIDFRANGSTARMRFNGTNLVVDQHLGMNGNHINSVNWIRMIGGYETVIHKHPSDIGGALVDSQKLTIGLGFRDDFTNIASFYGRIDFMQNLHMNGNNIQSVSRVALDGSNTHFLSHHAQAGGVLVDSTRFTIGIGSHTSGFNDRVVVTNSQINLLAHASISGFNLYRVNRLELDGTNGYYMNLSSGTAVVDTRMVTIGIGNPSSVDRVADFYGRIDFFKNLNMNGNVINNQSDARLKTNIVEHEQSSLEKINAFNFVDFTWIKNGREDFGLIAQEVQQVAPELISEDSQGILSINNTLLNMMTTHAIQELSERETNTNLLASTALIKAETNEEKIKRLENEIEELRGMCA